MAFPVGWPPRPSSASRNIHVLIEGVADGTYANNAYLFIDQDGANPFQVTPYVEAGSDEKLVTPLADSSPFPLGTGQDHRDAIQYHPNVFLRGTGAGDTTTTFTQNGNTTTYYDQSAKFNRGHVNHDIRFQGATTAGNNGTFLITEVVDERTIRYENISGTTENFAAGGDWRLRQVKEAVPKAMIWSNTIRVTNLGTNNIYFSFDGENDHNYVPAGESKVYRNMSEAGIALRTDAGTSSFIVEAW